MKKYRICIVGNCNDNCVADGQSIRTTKIRREFEKRYGDDRVRFINYRELKHSYVKLFTTLVSSFFSSERILIISIGDSIRTLVPVCMKINGLFHRKMYFVLIGGSLPEKVKDKKNLECARRLDGVFVQTDTIVRGLVAAGMDSDRIHKFPNFKDAPEYKVQELESEYKEPYRVVFMSRVCEEKGVTETIETFRRVNQDSVKFTLDIYGDVEGKYKQELEEAGAYSLPYINMRGVADAWKTTEIMHDYFLHLFPTKFPTEGFATCVLDAFLAGVPTLAARWVSYDDIIAEGVTGLSFEQGNFDNLENKLNEIYDNPEKIISMKKNCIETGRRFTPESVFPILAEEIEK